jgi:glycine betaine catabolism A
VEGVDYDVNRIKWMWEKTGEKDAMICENNQKGVNSKFYNLDHTQRWKIA